MGVYEQFAVKFNSVEEMEAYKKRLSEERKLQTLEVLKDTVEEENPDSTRVAPSITPADTTEPKPFISMYHGKATDVLARMSSKGAKINPITGSATIDSGELKVVIQKFTDLRATLGVNTHKLLSVGVARFTALNNYNRKGETSLQYAVQIPLEAYAYSLGYDVLQHETDTPEEAEKEKKRASNALKDAKKKIRKDLDTLASMELTWEEKVKGKAGDYEALHIIGTRGIRNGYINITFDPIMAQYLAKLPITQYPIALLRIDARNSNAYSMGLKFSEHFNMDNNQIRGTAQFLKVKTLLELTSLPAIEKVRAEGRRWEDRIKEPFENSLDALTACGLLENWEYSHSKGVTLTNEEATNWGSYEKWENTLVHFSLKDAPDHRARLEARAKRNTKKTSKKKTED
jgi:hypothetical protein